ncbi:SDR family NAD(P)-dependent oxidoreductase [Paenibacillus soyae]|uniref:SDR family NAD(P)-dependent oxidoreductase n=1 Tax=Paenibacillus soyae TaxID=2969249 RepID=A0A9X2MRT9_9BACL|nr:SDR family NAD(P)-dependent oxidoreductase [Paenibacillus soyae]MCR2804648.1 SDR family NAD(P)-dependent oxidoreductase [Paenibacillus soyae]
MHTAFVTGADRGLGLELTRGLLERGWRVIAGRYLENWHELTELAGRHEGRAVVVPLDIGSDRSVRDAANLAGASADAIDLVIHNAAVSTSLKDLTIAGGLNYEDMIRIYNINAIGMLRVTEALLYLTDAGTMKRQCIVSSEAGSIERCSREAWYGYCMSKAALNMGAVRLHENLHADGYTFRLLHPGWMKTYMSGSKNEEAELEADVVAEAALRYFIGPGEEDHRLVMKDWAGGEWPW